MGKWAEISHDELFLTKVKCLFEDVEKARRELQSRDRGNRSQRDYWPSTSEGDDFSFEKFVEVFDEQDKFVKRLFEFLMKETHNKYRRRQAETQYFNTSQSSYQFPSSSNYHHHPPLPTAASSSSTPTTAIIPSYLERLRVANHMRDRNTPAVNSSQPAPPPPPSAAPRPARESSTVRSRSNNTDGHSSISPGRRSLSDILMLHRRSSDTAGTGGGDTSSTSAISRAARTTPDATTERQSTTAGRASSSRINNRADRQTETGANVGGAYDFIYRDSSVAAARRRARRATVAQEPSSTTGNSDTNNTSNAIGTNDVTSSTNSPGTARRSSISASPSRRRERSSSMRLRRPSSGSRSTSGGVTLNSSTVISTVTSGDVNSNDNAAIDATEEANSSSLSTSASPSAHLGRHIADLTFSGLPTAPSASARVTPTAGDDTPASGANVRSTAQGNILVDGEDESGARYEAQFNAPSSQVRNESSSAHISSLPSTGGAPISGSDTRTETVLGGISSSANSASDRRRLERERDLLIRRYGSRELALASMGRNTFHGRSHRRQQLRERERQMSSVVTGPSQAGQTETFSNPLSSNTAGSGLLDNDGNLADGITSGERTMGNVETQESNSNVAETSTLRRGRLASSLDPSSYHETPYSLSSLRGLRRRRLSRTDDAGFPYFDVMSREHVRISEADLAEIRRAGERNMGRDRNQLDDVHDATSRVRGVTLGTLPSRAPVLLDTTLDSNPRLRNRIRNGDSNGRRSSYVEAARRAVNLLEQLQPTESVPRRVNNNENNVHGVGPNGRAFQGGGNSGGGEEDLL
eukprot:Nk52_evm49s2367 gene=Nk52_evmTU49s2367